MSQSDYIKFIKTATLINDQAKNPPVLSQQTYIDDKQFSVEIGVSYTKEYLNLLRPDGKGTIFNMPKTVTSCPTFLACSNTENRPNRVPMKSIYFTPKPVFPYVKHKQNKNLMCNCITNKKFSNSMFMNVKKCKCKENYH